MKEIEQKQNVQMPVNIEDVESKIIKLRGMEVLLDRDIAQLYGVKNKANK